MIKDEKSQSEDFVSIGTFTVQECRKLLKELEDLGIPFDTVVDDSAIKKMDAATAGTGGTFGFGAGLEVFVHDSDKETAITIREKLGKKWIV
jgi:hypothetical protein